MKFLIGCDPEVFVKQNGVFKSAHGLIKGDKKNPFKVKKGAVQVDGMALEFNIDPANSEDEFCLNVQEVYNTLKLMVPEYEIAITPVADFDPLYLKNQPDEAKELGCDPDFNAWKYGAPNPRPDNLRPMRTASGHVHIGWTDKNDVRNPDHIGNCISAAKQMDFFLGLPSLFYDPDNRRREMYGNPGCYRVKPYGVEYRTLSNAWLSSEKLTRWVYRAAVNGMEQLVNGNALFEKYGDISSIIKNGKKKEAEKILNSEGIEICYG